MLEGYSILPFLPIILTSASVPAEELFSLVTSKGIPFLPILIVNLFSNLSNLEPVSLPSITIPSAKLEYSAFIPKEDNSLFSFLAIAFSSVKPATSTDIVLSLNFISNRLLSLKSFKFKVKLGEVANSFTSTV
ncbi:hypothetical protein SDC9_153257 [bioreactor metagenome]|uniref:Uncharacterized protein n=1 Tax=bioreactor metagenome TaxID=1076179 RepID=A0A645F021_9ZZZZ